MRRVFAGFYEAERIPDQCAWMLPGQEKNEPHPQMATFLWSPSPDSGIHTTSRHRVPSTITWSWSMGPSLLLYGCQLSVSCGYLVNLLNAFQSCKSYSETQVEQRHGKFEHSELVLWQIPKDSCPRLHLGYSSLSLSCFAAPVQMPHIWQKLTGQAVSQWERFSK